MTDSLNKILVEESHLELRKPFAKQNELSSLLLLSESQIKMFSKFHSSRTLFVFSQPGKSYQNSNQH
jgi:hypothetical protein